MAENETLTKTASRLRIVQCRLRAGTAVSECFLDIRRPFYLALRAAYGDWEKQGVTPEQLLITALQQPTELKALVRRTGHQQYARILLKVAESERFLGLEQLVGAWLQAVWDSVQDQLELDLRLDPTNDEFRRRVMTMLRSLAESISRRPNRIPNVPRPTLDDELNRPFL